MAIKHFRCDYTKYQSEPCWDAVCIPLSRGRHGLISIKDYHLVTQQQWFAVDGKTENLFYMKSHIRGADLKTKIQSFHRIIMKPPVGVEVDHINGNSLDNRRCNLRFCTKSQNQMNRKSQKGQKYKGVTRSYGIAQWDANIKLDGKNIYLGRHSTPELAAAAYNEAAAEYYGDYARFNVIENSSCK